MQPDCTTPPLKTCTKCGHEYPATRGYFHASKRSKSGLRYQCKPCEAAYWADYHVTHRAEKAANDAAYRATHREERAAWRAEHRDEVLAYQAAYNAEHREEMVAYRVEHRDEIAARHVAWYAEHREEMAAYRAEHTESRAAYTRNRRARQKGNGGTHTAADVTAQYERQRGKCFWCEKKLDKYHVDHVTPVILGGSNGPENLVIACPTCNMTKNAKHPMDFAGRLL